MRLTKAATRRRPLTLFDATGVAEAMLGLDGFRVLAVDESAAEVVILIETSAGLVGCPGCGVVARAHDRMAVECRDLAAFGRPARLVWDKRRWRLRGVVVQREDLDRVFAAVPSYQPRRRRVLSPGRSQRPPGHPGAQRGRR